VDHQVEAVDVEVQELAVPRHPGDRQAAERGHRRVVGLERGDGENIDPRDGVADRALAQEDGERLDLWQFGHASQYPSRHGPHPCGYLWKRLCTAPGVPRLQVKYLSKRCQSAPWLVYAAVHRGVDNSRRRPVP
jgi:hypothetical protein